jgi:hypothetical protein
MVQKPVADTSHTAYKPSLVLKGTNYFPRLKGMF